MTLIAIFTTSFVIALSGALMPGPLLTVTISESSRRGGVAGPLIIAGHGLLELTLVGALICGLAPVLQRAEVFVIVAILGGLVLLWMAISMFRSLSGLSLDLVKDNPPGGNLIIAGILFSLANPYWFIWWVSIGLGYILYSAQFGAAGVISFFAGHIMADLAWYAFISYGVARGRRYCSDRAYRRLIGCCAMLLVVFSGWFLYSGITRLLPA